MEILERKTAPAFRQVDQIQFIRAEKSKLDNGIPVYAVNAGEQELVKIEFVFMNSYREPSEVFIASAANRMLAEGTKHHTGQQLADRIDYYGAFYETEESLDYNSVNLYTLSKYVGQTLPFLKEILCEPTFPEKELGIFRQNTKQRLQVNMEKVSYLSRTGFHEMLFGKNHPYGYRPEMSDIEAITSGELEKYYTRCYDFSRCIIFVSGKIQEHVISLLNATFGNLPASAHQNGQLTNKSPEPFIDKSRFHRKQGAIQSALRVGKPMFNKTHPDYHKMLVLSTVLGGYFGSRLMANLREDKGYTYGIGCSMVSLKQGGYFVISTEVGGEVSKMAMREIHAEINKLRNEPVPREELKQVKNYLAGALLRSMDGAFNLSDRAKGLVLYGLDYDYFEHYFSVIKEIQPDDLLEMAKKYFDPESFYQLEVGDK